MLGRIPLHRLDALNLRPIIRRYVSPMSSHRRLLSDSPAATAAAKDRRWVMLSSYGHRRPDDSSLDAEDVANTVAESRTTEGRCVRVSFRCAVPPSSSFLYYEFPDSSRGIEGDCISVVSAHGELILLKMHNSRSPLVEDYFVYRPAGASRLPSLSLLPVPDFPNKSEKVPASYFDQLIRPRLDNGCIGLLRRGENDLLVVHVDMWYDRDAGCEKAVFCVLRHGMEQWELMEPVPVFTGSPGDVISFSDWFLCDISYSSGFLLCDMADEANPKVRYVSLPLEVRRCSYGYDDNLVRFRRMGTANDSSVSFVSIHPNCCRSVDPDHDLYINDKNDCCCRERGTECWHPRFVFSIKTWTMNLSMHEPLEWVEDGEIDAEEIWALPGYEGLPQAIPEWPVVSLDNPNVICFLVSNYHFTKYPDKLWMVRINITTKTLLSVVQLSSSNYDWSREYYHLPAEIQY